MCLLDNSTIARALAKRFRLYRELAELTQSEAALKIEISSHHLSKMETGVNTPTVARMVRMAEVYGCTVGDFWVDVDARLRAEQQASGYLVDEAAAARANLTELTRAITFLLDLTRQTRKMTDEQLLHSLLAEAEEQRKRTLKEGK